MFHTSLDTHTITNDSIRVAPIFQFAKTGNPTARGCRTPNNGTVRVNETADKRVY